MAGRSGWLIAGLCTVLLGAAVTNSLAFNPWTFPKLPPPEEYGGLLIDRSSTANGVLAVGFSHWSHRLRYTCRVCHEELGFTMFVNTTEITEQESRKGQFCGACHNGTIAFGHTEKHCRTCHSGKIPSNKAAFARLDSLPRTPFGNKIDWVAALNGGLIKPKQSLREAPSQSMGFNRKLDLESRWSGIPPAVFPHAVHNQWLDCANCHPDIFNIKKKSTEHFEMVFILERKFCGVCHLKVAFPLDDCKRCHPGMKS